MSIADGVTDGLAALVDVLPANPYLASCVGAAAAGVLVGGVWTASNPARMTAGHRPALTPTHLHRKATTVERASEAPLEIPLDVVPKDSQGRTPFDIIGADAITTAVEQFYSKLCADPDLTAFFHHIDMANLKRHQALFIGQLWGGPVVFPLERLAEAHQHLNISSEQYWRVCGHLMVTLTRLDVPHWICVFTMTRLYQARNLIIVQEPAPSAARPEV